MRIGSLFSGYGGLDLAVAAHYGATAGTYRDAIDHYRTTHQGKDEQCP